MRSPTAAVALAIAAAALASAHAQPRPPASSNAPGWQGCCGVTPWGHGGGMMGGGMMGGGMMGGHGGGHGPGMMGGSAARHHAAMMGGVPAPYAGMTNPLPKTAATIERGAAVYAKHCASCHGLTGLGDGEAARTLSPRPANLAWLSNVPLSGWDPFMYWTIAEGGAPFGTAMPAFKDTLAKDDIWAAVGYIQAHLPATTARR